MSVAANMMMFNSSRREREEREVYEKALKLLQRAAGISGETTDDIKNFVFDINGKVLSSLRASYPQYSLSDDSSILLDIWNQVDHQVRNILQHGLYKDTTIEKAIINDTFEGMINYKKTITNIHELLPELDLDTLFKIMEAIVEETTPIINWPNSIRTPLSDKPWWEEPNRITCTYNSK